MPEPTPHPPPVGPVAYQSISLEAGHDFTLAAFPVCLYIGTQDRVCILGSLADGTGPKHLLLRAALVWWRSEQFLQGTVPTGGKLCKGCGTAGKGLGNTSLPRNLAAGLVCRH